MGFKHVGYHPNATTIFRIRGATSMSWPRDPGRDLRSHGAPWWRSGGVDRVPHRTGASIVHSKINVC